MNAAPAGALLFGGDGGGALFGDGGLGMACATSWSFASAPFSLAIRCDVRRTGGGAGASRGVSLATRLAVAAASSIASLS